MTKTRAVFNLCLSTFLILGGLTAINAATLFSRVDSKIFKPTSRGIASIPELNEVKKISQPQAPVIAIDCTKKSNLQKTKTLAANARFYLKNCSKAERITNLSNQSQGDVFLVGKKMWTSDYMSLKPGKNVIQIPTDSTTQNIEITREVADLKSESSNL